MKKSGNRHIITAFSAGRQRADTRNVATTLFATAAAATGMLTAKEGRVLSLKCDHVMKVTRTRKQPPHENKQERAALFRTSEQVLSLLVFSCRSL